MKWRVNLAKAAITIDRVVTEIIVIVLVTILLFVISSVVDSLLFSMRGTRGVKYCNFDELLRINPDTCAWLRIDDTHINHPVVQGKDDYKYLDTDFYGNFYAGGTLFLSHENKKDFSDDYNMIHGHHMAMGAMFGDLGNYNDRKYFDEHKAGVILTPGRNYRLELMAVCKVNSHDSGFYSVGIGFDEHIKEIKREAVHLSGAFDGCTKILVLSTCTGDFDDYRTVVVFNMKYDSELKSFEEERADV